GETVTGQCASHHRIEVGLGDLGDRLDVSGVLRDQGDDTGQYEHDEGEAERRGMDADDTGRLVRERRQAEPRSGDNAVPVHAEVFGDSVRTGVVGGDRSADAIENPGQYVTEQQCQEDGDTAEEAAQHDATHDR